MRVCLVTMPWQSLDIPSLPLSLLRASISASRAEDEVATHYANLRWAEFVLDRTEGAVTPDDYTNVVEDGLFHGLGDWVFTSALYGAATWPVERYERHATRVDLDDTAAHVMRELAPEFVRDTAEEILAQAPDVVGLTSTFMQNVPSLALAAEVKARRPDVKVVMGGGNCEGPMGAALHRNFETLDYVVRGEGEQAVVALLDALADGGEPSELRSIGGLCWRDEGRSTANRDDGEPLAMDDVPAPAFDDYFAALAAGPLREYIEPKLVHESARGCWWGMRKHCTFCGLNGSTMAFRSKAPDRVFSEVERHVRQHKVLDVVMVDNIMDTSYFETLLPRLAATDWDLRVHYEVKSNLRRAQVRALAEAGVVHVQPGIESLSTRVLDLMGKGVDSVMNVRLLRDCEELRVTSSWNYLYGFPGEEAGDYEDVLGQLANLHHLQPPGVATRIALERFSPYHARPELGFGVRRPAGFYRHVYDLPERELVDLVYVFDTDRAGIDGDLEQRLLDGVAAWQDAYAESSLLLEERGGELVVHDRRVGRPSTEHVLRRPWQVAAYHSLADGHGAASLAKTIGRLDITLPGDAELDGWLADLAADGLVYSDAGRFVALATADRAARVPLGRWQ